MIVEEIVSIRAGRRALYGIFTDVWPLVALFFLPTFGPSLAVSGIAEQIFAPRREHNHKHGIGISLGSSFCLPSQYIQHPKPPCTPRSLLLASGLAFPSTQA